MVVEGVTDPTTQHLYVMQNEFGCIKIGRSVDPWRRTLKLRTTEHCKVELVAAFEGGGEFEEAIHIKLDEFRLEGEWFDGVAATRTAIGQIFGPEPLEWKFQHDLKGAAKWLNHLRVVRNANYIRNTITRQIGILRTATAPSWIYDGDIFWCRHLAKTGERPAISVETRKGQTINVWHHIGANKGEVLPAYTSSIDLALLAWPDDLRPASWEGSPIECCIAALVAIRAQLPKVARLATEGA